MIRTINGAVKELRNEDPNTAVNSDTVRRWIASGKLKHVKSGKRVLIDMDVLKEYMKGE